MSKDLGRPTDSTTVNPGKMSEDRLLEIIEWFCSSKTRASFDDVVRIKWLISELEACREEIEKWVACTMVHNFDEMDKCPIFYDYCRCSTPENTKERLAKLQEENAELNHVFNFQRDRTAEAEKMWQQATGKHDMLPDLGVLLEWLMANIAELEEFNSECEDRYKIIESSRDTLSDELKWAWHLWRQEKETVAKLKKQLTKRNKQCQN